MIGLHKIWKLFQAINILPTWFWVVTLSTKYILYTVDTLLSNSILDGVADSCHLTSGTINIDNTNNHSTHRTILEKSNTFLSFQIWNRENFCHFCFIGAFYVIKTSVNYTFFHPFCQKINTLTANIKLTF